MTTHEITFTDKDGETYTTRTTELRQWVETYGDYYASVSWKQLPDEQTISFYAVAGNSSRYLGG